MVELARLESVYIRKGIKGSNPFSSAAFKSPVSGAFLFPQINGPKMIGSKIV